ncbi:hypothetical protein LCGC14_0927660, partial [marine sediment metagenome]
MTEIDQFNDTKSKKNRIIKQARFSENYKLVIDSNNEMVEFDDPRIVFVDPVARNS